MKKGFLVALICILLMLIGGSVWYLWFREDSDNTGTKATTIQEKMVYKEETASAPSWIPNVEGGGNPWYQDLMIATSEDGLTFTEGELFLPHAGVGHLLLTDDDELIATFQYFSYTNEELFDKICYSISEDYGETWSAVKLLNIDMPTDSGFMVGPNAVDPTLMQLEDGSFRLYFTYEKHGDGGPTLYSASSKTIDGLFEWEGRQLDPNGTILDPAVIYFDNTWHHYTTNHDQFGGDTVDNIHSTSKTGQDFEQQDDISIGMSMLGDVIEFEDGLRFYSGADTAFSEDGYEWEVDGSGIMEGADPGVAGLPDGSYIAIYTGGSSN